VVLEKTDVLVIGAGIAGLACGRALTQEGLDVVLLEARDHVGGRIRTLRLPGEEPVELGAHVIHGDVAATWELIGTSRLRVKRLEPSPRILFRVHDVVLSASVLLAADGTPPWALEQELGGRQARDRPVGEILSAHSSRFFDLTIALEWVMHRWGGDPDELSDAGIGRIRRAWRAGEGQFVVIDGYDRIPEILAAGIDVRLGTAVRRVRWSQGSIFVEAPGLEIAARAAVVSVPPTVVASHNLLFYPELPDVKVAAARAIDLGDAIVVVAGIGEPAPWSADALIVGECGGFWKARKGSQLVQGWFRGRNASAARAAGVDPTLIERLVAPLFPWVRSDTIREVHVADWGTDPYTLGAYSYPRVGFLEIPRHWAAPLVRTLFFAGEAVCTNGHRGLVHGALESGQQAARSVLHAL
jgi:monoamine oxidase